MTVLDLSMECGRHHKEFLSPVRGGSAASMVLSVPCCIHSSMLFVLCLKVTESVPNLSLGLSCLWLFPQLLDMGEFGIS